MTFADDDLCTRCTVHTYIHHPHDRREGVLFFVRSTFGTTTLISRKFEIVFTHDPIPV